jgi:hypothetical protein
MESLKGKLPYSVKKYLEGIEFPITKERAVNKLKENGVPEKVVNQLDKRLPEGEYNSPKEMMNALRGK